MGGTSCRGEEQGAPCRLHVCLLSVAEPADTAPSRSRALAVCWFSGATSHLPHTHTPPLHRPLGRKTVVTWGLWIHANRYRHLRNLAFPHHSPILEGAEARQHHLLQVLTNPSPSGEAPPSPFPHRRRGDVGAAQRAPRGGQAWTACS